MTQLRLGGTENPLAPWPETRALVRAMVAEVGVDALVEQFGGPRSQILNQLEERHGRHLPAKWLPFLVAKSGPAGDAYLTWMVQRLGRDLVEAPPLDPAAEIEILKAALGEELGQTVRATILQKAASMARTRRRK